MRSSLGKFVKLAFIVVILSSCQKTPKFPTMLSSVKPRPATIETVQVEIPRTVYQEALKEQHYLRQLRIIPIVVGASEGTAIPVSYTHLDVYKRQRLARPGVSERAVAWELEKFMREAGAEAVAFDTVCLLYTSRCV